MKLRSAKTYELPPSDKAKGRSSTLKSRSEAKRAAAKRKAVANHNRGSKRSRTTEEIELAPVFHYFQKLPIELRLKIWKEVCRFPRIVEPLSSNKPNFPSESLAPALLHVCREAREEGLKIYEMLPSYGDLSRFRETYINWQVDYVLVPVGAKRKKSIDPSSQNPPFSLSRFLKHEGYQKCLHLIIPETEFIHFLSLVIKLNRQYPWSFDFDRLKTLESLSIALPSPHNGHKQRGGVVKAMSTWRSHAELLESRPRPKIPYLIWDLQKVNVSFPKDLKIGFCQLEVLPGYRLKGRE
ncbi:hypothetical protein GLAREA_09226 [Glarea lozoyensis ATCC 20868]|uniref:2EXR domain-containing protein n=1 Tax=Glarea lozoyensis (strain ATCC 20868 / MF5171) TaxID=1116229 RepID=S3EFU6_GLAL2|nr:uncharacterized protein GLAREA_09226 [Glarea lozoyensis ATCC 20868]EPE37063.1 hypothetical protein GLAREA_09226 [Glarea lozoyensis ATCC 20868]